ncbi:MAG: hypothetical protein M9945_12490 [Aquamicrobium sp.]|uniref:hypothetical protein n=1 Tax=Aquamicrobium sp. TaxID=1872579 RepID=UPI00349ECBC4|nr:hypothetical protein [Aquamicrobium sp.]
MTRYHSVRLRFVDRLHRIIDDVRKQVAKVLRHDHAHPDTGADGGFCRVCGVRREAGETQVHDAEIVPVFRDQINEKGLNAIVANVEPPVSYGEYLAALDSDLRRNSTVFIGQDHPSLLNMTAGEIMRAGGSGVHPNPEEAA